MNNLSDQLKAATTTVIITPEPLIMEKPGETFRGVYLGIRPFDKLNQTTGEWERKPVAHFYDGARVLFNMGAQLTRAVENLPTGISVEIVLRELSPNKNKDGKTKIYSVAPLDLPRFDLAEMFGGILELTAPKPEHLLPPPTNDEQPAQIEAPANAANEQKPLTYVEAVAKCAEYEIYEDELKAHLRQYLAVNGYKGYSASRDSVEVYRFIEEAVSPPLEMEEAS